MDSGWRLRPLREADIPDVQHTVDEHVRTGLLMDRPFGADEAARLVQRTAAELPADGRGAIWGIADSGADGSEQTTVRGVITLRATDDNRAQIGFWLSGRYRGRGVAAAAVRALAQQTLGPEGLVGLTWTSPVGNVDSLRVARAAGFHPVGTRSMAGGVDASLQRSWWAELCDAGDEPDHLWAECLVEIAAGAWQLQPMDARVAAAAEQLLPVSACVPTGVWAAKEITTARVDAVVALLHRGDRAWVLAQPAAPTAVAQEAAVAAAEVVLRYARRALGLITP